MKNLCYLSLAEMRAGLLAKDFSAVELTKAHLSHIKETNKILNSFITICEKEALRAAEAADKTLSETKKLSPMLCGIPIALKDMLVTKEIETTAASRILKGFISPYDCTVVCKVKQAGGIIVGKTNQDEFGMGSSSEQSAFGAVKNPWDTSRVPGGSSGGSAVAVSVGQCPISLGTDTGGSIRQPSALTGVIGLKPTYGRVSRYGCIAYASSLDQIGPFARTVKDLAVILGIISGKDEKDSTSMDIAVPNYVKELEDYDPQSVKNLKIGIPKEYFISGMNQEIEAACKRSIKTFEKLGAEIVDISLPNTDYALATYYIIVPAEASSNLARYDGVRYAFRAESDELSAMYERTRQQGFGAEVKRRIMIGSYVLSAGYYDAYYLKAQKVRTLICNDFKEAFASKCDLILAPVSPWTAFKIGERMNSPLSMYLADIWTVPVNLAGLPGLAIPVGLNSENLPIGMQLIGKPFSESQMLCVADLFLKEQAFETLRTVIN